MNGCLPLVIILVATVAGVAQTPAVHTFTPERWYYVGEHADWSRRWLATLPLDVAERIAWKNGEALFGGLLAAR